MTKCCNVFIEQIANILTSGGNTDFSKTPREEWKELKRQRLGKTPEDAAGLYNRKRD